MSEKIQFNEPFIKEQKEALDKALDEDNYEKYRDYFFNTYVPQEINRRKLRIKKLEAENNKTEKEDRKKIAGDKIVDKNNFTLENVESLMKLPDFSPTPRLDTLWKQFVDLKEKIAEASRKRQGDILQTLNKSLGERKIELINEAYFEYNDWFNSPERKNKIAKELKDNDELIYPKTEQERDFEKLQYPTKEEDKELQKALEALQKLIEAGL